MNQFAIITLPENFRSAKAICRAASKLIAHNHGGVEKKIVPMREDEGVVATRVFENERAEEKFVINHVADLLEKPHDETIFDWKKPSVAILCRTNFEVEKWRDVFLNEGLKVGTRKMGAENLPEKWDVLKRTIAFFANPESSYLAHRFLRSIWTEKQADDARDAAVKRGVTLNQHALNFPNPPATDPVSMKGFLDAKSGVPLSTIDWLCERLKELPSGLSMSDILLMLNEHESQGSKADEDVDLEVLTCHGAKSREWNHVVSPGWSEGNFPRGNGDVPEDRRLAYVCITRARDSFLATCSLARWTKWSGVISCSESRFLKELL